MTTALQEAETEEQANVRRIEELMAEARAAKQDFVTAGKAFAGLSQQESQILNELMGAALAMHNAKIRVDAALKAIKDAAGFSA